MCCAIKFQMASEHNGSINRKENPWLENTEIESVVGSVLLLSVNVEKCEQRRITQKTTIWSAVVALF